MNHLEETDEEFRMRVNLETAQMPWQDLQRFFAAGQVIYVSHELDLVEVALLLAKDDAKQIKQWMSAQHIGLVTDSQAQTWIEQEYVLWTLVVKPWVLVQPPKAH